MGRSSRSPASEGGGDRRRFVAAGTVFGFGLGGLADGIVLHHVLQWHSLTSNVVARDELSGLQRNLVADGWFHLAMTVVLVVGFALLWRAWSRPDQRVGTLGELLGWLLIGWGAFHAVDQLLFHLLLGLHDIRDDVARPELYNWGFFAIGVALAAIGVWLVGRTRRP